MLQKDGWALHLRVYWGGWGWRWGWGGCGRGGVMRRGGLREDRSGHRSGPPRIVGEISADWLVNLAGAVIDMRAALRSCGNILDI